MLIFPVKVRGIQKARIENRGPFLLPRFFRLIFRIVCIRDQDCRLQYDWSDVYYGWALFEYSYGRLTLVDSALNTGGGGIYAGTSITVPIPEPSSWALAALGVAALLRRRHSHRLQGCP